MGIQNETNTTLRVLYCVHGLSHQIINNLYYSLSTDRRVQDEVNMIWDGDGHSSLED